ncbi:ovomucoid-like [Pelobates cultripes]|uniref:Ovomucoid-like n=1 Tax=Pelobates cultripes TaxID=61616 RepID=A0AAD1RVN3_PELCU|nr:ovomucoid-like [Pelobates cultripes]
MKTTGGIVLAFVAVISFSCFTTATRNQINCNKYQKGEPFPCDKSLMLLCGTDGNTYGNKCLLCKEKLMRNPSLGVKHEGSCDIEGTRLDCKKYIDQDWCTLEYQAHCGSDGNTYGNECAYCNAQNTNPTLTLLFKGECFVDKD